LSLRFLERQGGGFQTSDDAKTPAFAKNAKGRGTQSTQKHLDY